MEELTSLSEILKTLGPYGNVIVIFWLIYKMGIIKIPFIKNGNGKHGEITELKTEIENLKSNHISHLEEVMKDMKEDNSEFRRELNEHAQKEVELLNKIVLLLEIKK